LNKILFSQIILQQNKKKITLFLNFTHSFLRVLPKFKKILKDFWSHFFLMMFKKTLWQMAFFPLMFLLSPISAIFIKPFKNFTLSNYINFFFGFLYNCEFYFLLDFSKILDFSLEKSFQNFSCFFNSKILFNL